MVGVEPCLHYLTQCHIIAQSKPRRCQTEEEMFARSLATQNIARANPETFAQSAGPRLEGNGNASLDNIPNAP